MRPPRTRITDYPDTVRMGGRGLCDTCHQRATGDGTIHQYPRAPKASGAPLGDYDLYAPLHPIGHDDPDPRVRDCARELTIYIYDRRERGIPVKGIGT